MKVWLLVVLTVASVPDSVRVTSLPNARYTTTNPGRDRIGSEEDEPTDVLYRQKRICVNTGTKGFGSREQATAQGDLCGWLEFSFRVNEQ
ncbi:Hypp1972 [Branchiostoma lanceolatum]|uniref:Hypp1972 protein n=1 Tax=Branchiostoma lanceolatum TaxID=7740 RepID=A0A8K0EN77_BRALA|nr:Hypp1972 [Branchiostoma lanceolatum]